jgi:uncharacterized membrane protein YedE/YeeE
MIDLVQTHPTLFWVYLASALLTIGGLFYMFFSGEPITVGDIFLYLLAASVPVLNTMAGLLYGSLLLGLLYKHTIAKPLEKILNIKLTRGKEQ